jgi:hypothetical protein
MGKNCVGKKSGEFFAKSILRRSGFGIRLEWMPQGRLKFIEKKSINSKVFQKSNASRVIFLLILTIDIATLFSSNMKKRFSFTSLAVTSFRYYS